MYYLRQSRGGNRYLVNTIPWIAPQKLVEMVKEDLGNSILKYEAEK